LAEIVFFAADRRQTEAGNLAKFINLARNELTVFGSDLNWDADYWKSAGVTFANLDQKSRSYNSNNSLNPSFRDFAKAYYRYQQGHRPTKNTIIVIMLRCLRSHDPALSLHPSLTEISEQIAVKIPMTQQEFNTLSMPTAHITAFGFCLHDFVMSPCQRFRDCLNCSEQVCIKGDRRLEQIRGIYSETKRMKDEADRAIREGTAGADRWYEIQTLSAMRLKALIDILEDPTIEDGALIRLHIEKEFNPLRLALENGAGDHSGTGIPEPSLGALQKLGRRTDGQTS
jgi:hypothetical protein